MTRLSFAAALAVAVVLWLGNSALANPDDTQLIVFGDSLSDTGNLDREGPVGDLIAKFADLGPTGTFSNGPVWHDYLADSLGLPRTEPSLDGGTNYAIGGAETDEGGAIEGFLADILLGQQTGIAAQVDVFLTGLPAGVADPDALHLVWGGGNDMRGESDPAAAASAVDNVEQHLRNLAAAGGRHFLVPNLPNLGRTPESITAGSDAVELAESITLAFNDDLATTLDGLSAELSLDLFELDIFAALEEIINDPQPFGFSNVTEPCPDPDSACTGYLFWDTIHPTTAAHRLLGQRAFGLLDIPIAGDLNDDGLVNGLDVDPFVAQLVTGSFTVSADMNGDGLLNGLDVDPFVAAVVGGQPAGSHPVPEPATLSLLALALLALAPTVQRR
jgi:outer membrane lipase/esterase